MSNVMRAMRNTLRYFYTLLLCLFCVVTLMKANDFTEFNSDNNDGLFNVPSISELQTNIDLNTNTSVRESQTPQQISLLRRANIQRNGKYVMIVTNMIPVQRLSNSEKVVGFGMGLGIRSGIISYLDNYIGIRGYFALDFTNDKISPIKKQQELYNGTFLMASLGVDILVDFFIDKNYKNTLGFFIGVGAGALAYFDFSAPIVIPNVGSKNYVLTANVMVQGGISAVLAYKHRVELGIRFLPTQSLAIETDGIVADYNFYVGYSYKF